MITKKVKGNICPWLTKDIKNKMNDRDKMLRKARKSKQEIDWSAYKLCRNRVQAQIKKCKSQYYKNLLKNSLNSSDKFWKAIKSVFPTKAMSPKTNPSFNVDGKTITDINVIANVFCRYFSTVANSLKRKSKWKIAKVIPLYKSGPKSDIGNYRQLSGREPSSI